MDDILDLLILGTIGGALFLWWRSRQAPASSSAPIAPAEFSPDPQGARSFPDNVNVYAAPPPADPPAAGYMVSYQPPPASSSTSSSAIQPTQVSGSGAAYIRNTEQLRLSRYPDAGGESIGYGHKIKPGEAIGATITAADAEYLFLQDLTTVEAALNSLVRVPLTQSEYDALADLVYNIGAGAFTNSTLLKKLNAGDYQGARAEFPRWIYSQGKILGALVERRNNDAQMFSTGWGYA